MRKFLAVLALLATSACATPYVAIPYEADQNPVATITLIEDVGSANVMAYEFASAGGNFGLVGAIVDAGVQSSRRARVEEVLENAGFDAQAFFRTRLTEELEALGYAVEIAQIDGRNRADLMETYPDDGDEVQAYLDTVLRSYGFVSAGAGTPFRPHASVEAQLVNPDTDAVLKRNAVIYASVGQPQGQIVLSPNPRHVYNNREELLEDPDRLVDAVRAAISETAVTVARLLAP
jgi:hypothetical protein